MRKGAIIFTLFALLLVCVIIFFQERTPEDHGQITKKKAVYFYSETCPHCEKVDRYFNEARIYDDYDIEKIEASGPYNAAYLNRFFDVFNVSPDKRGFPVIFFQDKMIFGDDPIINSFVDEIEKVGALDVPTPDSVGKVLNVAGENKSSFSDVPPYVLFLAALVDAINPCAFAVIILLVGTVVSARGRRGGLYSGLAFSLAVFISYFSMGVGIYGLMGAFVLPRMFSAIIGAAAVIIGLANLKDFFWYGKIFVAEVPFGWRPRMQLIIRNVTGPLGALGAGFLMSLFLLPCTSGPYIAFLRLLAQKNNWTLAMPLLLAYNLIFILPMIIITFSMYFGIRAKGLEDWRQKNVRLLHLVAGAIMIFVGIYLILHMDSVNSF